MSRGAAACAAALTLLVAAAGARAEPLRFALVPERSFVHFEVRHFGTSTLAGRFGPLAGEIVVDRAARRGEVGIRVATAGVDTGVKALDARLRAADLFDSAGYPEAFFVARDFRFDAAGTVTEVRGEFTLRGTSQPLALRALRFACRDDAGAEVCGADFEGFVDRSDFGMSFGLPFVADRVRILVLVEARHPRQP